MTRMSMAKVKRFRYVKEPRVAFIVSHVSDGIDMDEKTHTGNDQNHDGGQRVELEGEIDLETSRMNPGKEVFYEGMMSMSCPDSIR